MKKLLMFVITMVLFAVPVFSQEEIPVPIDIMDVITNLGVYFGSFPGLVVLATFITAFVLRFLKKVEGKIAKSLIGIGISLLFAIGSNLANFGYLADVTWLVAILNGVGVGICSSLLFSVPIMKEILEWIEGQLKKE